MLDELFRTPALADAPLTVYHDVIHPMRMGRDRRERWLHARISGDLEDALKREARRRRSPVSLVVRNVLEGALNLVEDIVEDSLEIAARTRRFATDTHHGRSGSDGLLDDIYGWQELILNRPATCARCACVLTAGTGAYRGLGDSPRPPVFLCHSCVRRLRQPASHTEEGAR